MAESLDLLIRADPAQGLAELERRYSHFTDLLRAQLKECHRRRLLQVTVIWNRQEQTIRMTDEPTKAQLSAALDSAGVYLEALQAVLLAEIYPDRETRVGLINRRSRR